MSYPHSSSRGNLPDLSSLPKLPPEIRFDPIDCPSEAIEQANARDQRTGAREFEPVEIAIERIRTVKSPSPARLESWIQHPDERVVIAFLTKERIYPGSKTEQYVERYVTPRAIDQARNRTEVWTPLLDALSSSSRVTGQWVQSVVSPWIQQQKDPNVLRHIVFRTRSQEMIACIAKTATVMDRALMVAMIDAYPPAIVSLAGNKHVPPELMELLLDSLLTVTAPIHTDDVDTRDLAVTYSQLNERGARFRPDHIERLVELFQNHVHCSDYLDARVCDRVMILLKEHVHNTGDEDAALFLIEMAGKLNSTTWIMGLFYDPPLSPQSRLKATPRLARAALTHLGRFNRVLRVIARHSEIRQDPDVRRRLLQSRATDVLCSLARDGRPEEFTLLFKHLAREHPDVAFDLLKRCRQVARQTLSHVDLLPLLQAPSQEIRLGAMAFMGELQENSKSQSPVEQRRSREER